MILVPEAYHSQPKLKSEEGMSVKSFYSYFESLQEAWDGPALLVYSDGNTIGAALDRNGLRPARYMITKNSETGEELVHVMSEVGVTKALQQFTDDGTGASNLQLVDSGRYRTTVLQARLHELYFLICLALVLYRLGPGEMLSVNLNNGKLSLNDDIKRNVAAMRPYDQWVKESIIDLPTNNSPNLGENINIHKIPP